MDEGNASLVAERIRQFTSDIAKLSGDCNWAMKRVPGGVVRIGGLVSGDILVIWYHR